jgi:ribosomal protein S18 acetylase RimI-like enzyme
MTAVLLPLSEVPAARLVEIAKECGPFIRARGDSDYWLYGRLFGSTCRAAVENGTAIAFIVAFQGQDDPDELYIQDVAVARAGRRHGYARMLVESVVATARASGVSRVWLTSEAANRAAHAVWLSLGFVNPAADSQVDGVWVTADLKGPGRSRAVYELVLQRK